MKNDNTTVCIYKDNTITVVTPINTCISTHSQDCLVNVT